MCLAEKYDSNFTEWNWNLLRTDMNINKIKDWHIWLLTGSYFSLPCARRHFGNAFQSISAAARCAWQTATCTTWAGPLCAHLITLVPVLGVWTTSLCCSHCCASSPSWMGGAVRGVVLPLEALLSLQFETGPSPLASSEKLRTQLRLLLWINLV